MIVEPSSEADPFDELIERFTAQQQAGLRPTVEGYAAAHPEHADRIRELFPVLVVIEAHKPTPTDAADAPPVIAGYAVGRKVGGGGMGDVYEAVQLALGRRVALKVMKRGMQYSPAACERFRREARAAGTLHHTNIVAVFDTGETAGVPYYAMQFIDGRGLDQYIRRQREKDEEGASGPSRAMPDESVFANGLTAFDPAPTDDPDATVTQATNPDREPATATYHPPARKRSYFRHIAGLVASAADGLDHAHARGIVHRDIKPANLILDHAGTIWITDFGVARTSTDPRMTEAGVPGTRRYIAPERFRDDATAGPRADIYALGLTLYEAVTLRPAYDGAADDAMIRRILDAAPPRPRAVDPAVPRDLETVILKATAREPGDRYPTAGDFAADLRRFAADQPVTARRSSWAEQGWKWSRRNPAVAGLLAAVLLVSLAGAVISTIFAVQAEENATAARTSEGEATEKGKALAVALKTQEDATYAAKTALASEQDALAKQKAANAEKETALALATVRLGEVRNSYSYLQGIFAELNPEVAGYDDRPLQAVLGERLKKASDELARAKFSDPLTAANLQESLAVCNIGLGYPERAIPLLEAALPVFRNDPVAALRCRHQLGTARVATYRRDVDLGFLEETLRLAEQIHGKESAKAAHEAVILALGHRRREQFEKGLETIDRAIGILKTPGGKDAGVLMSALNVRADLLHAQKRFKDSVETLNGIVAGWPDVDRDSPRLLMIRNNLGMAYRDAGDLEKSREVLADVLARLTARLGWDHPTTLLATHNLAATCLDAGDAAAAIRLFELAVKGRTARRSADHPDTLISLGFLGSAYRKAKQPKEAEPRLKAALDGLRKHFPPNHHETTVVWFSLMRLYLDAKRIDEYVELVEDRYRALKKFHGVDHADTANEAAVLGEQYRQQGRMAAAVELLEEGLKGLRKHRPDARDTLAAMNNLARTYSALRDYRAAHPLFEHCYRVRQKTLGDRDNDTLAVLHNLADNHAHLQQFETAIDLFSRCLVEARAALPANHDTRRSALLKLATLHAGHGWTGSAIRLFEEAYANILRSGGPAHPDFTAVSTALISGYVQTRQHRKEEMIWRDRLEAVSQTHPEAHPVPMTFRSMIGRSLLAQRRFADAEKELRAVLAVWREDRPNLWTTFHTQMLVGEALLGRKKYGEAEPLLVESFEKMEGQMKMFPQIVPFVHDGADRLIRLAEETEKPDDAKKWREAKAKLPRERTPNPRRIAD